MVADASLRHSAAAPASAQLITLHHMGGTKGVDTPLETEGAASAQRKRAAVTATAAEGNRRRPRAGAIVEGKEGGREEGGGRAEIRGGEEREAEAEGDGGGDGGGWSEMPHKEKGLGVGETVTDGNWSDSGDWAGLSRTLRGVGAGGTLRARGGAQVPRPRRDRGAPPAPPPRWVAAATRARAATRGAARRCSPAGWRSRRPQGTHSPPRWPRPWLRPRCPRSPIRSHPLPPRPARPSPRRASDSARCWRFPV